MTSIVYPNQTVADAVSYNYDDLDRLTLIPGFVTSCGYDGDSNLQNMMFGNGINNHYDYRSDNERLQDIKIGPSGSLLTLNYSSYDQVGNIKQINNDYYNYDGRNRLTWEGNSQDASNGTGSNWLYDGAGNIATQNTYQSGQNQASVSYNCDQANRLNSMGAAVSLSYDSYGDCTQKIYNSTNTTWGYSYDGENQLTGITENGTQIETNAYDDSGMRIKRVDNGTTTYFLYSGANPLMEYSPADNAYKYYIYANNYAVAEETNGQVTYNHRDHLGSVRLTTDANGNVVDAMSYNAYGEATPSITDNFTGSTLDGWTAKTTAAQFLPDNGFLKIIHSTTDNCGDYLVKYFDQIENVSVQFDVTIGSYNNDCCSLGIELDGVRLVFYGNELYYYNNGWQLVGSVTFDVATQLQLNFSQNQVAILINNIPVYSVAGSFGPKSYLAFRDYGLCFGPVTNYISNLNITPLNPEDGQFTGKKYDPGTGLVYFGGRFYDPEVGRFLTQDPGKQGLNWYEYCNDNSVNLVDPNGKNPILAFLLGFAFGQSFSNPSHSPLEMLEKGCTGGLIAVGAYELASSTFALSNTSNETSIESSDSAYHAVTSSSAGQSVFNGIDPQFFNDESRFGAGFYVSNDAQTTISELAAHGNTATQIIGFNMNLSNQNVLDLTDPSVANEWGFSADSSVEMCQNIGSKAQALGYDVIAYPSFQDSGINFVLYDHFNDILQPETVTSVSN